MQELERVALTKDLPEHGLKAGDIGMIVHIYNDHKGYEVEFVTLGGELVALVSVYPSQIRPLEQDEIASARRVKSA
ncbi:MAG: DUF4926 domain-containing protein [Chloroflexota bacterium]|jgi:hypothetical protein|nr:MAG: DUF4926 domain-containing protein [Chloroflexota bacterium]